MSRIIKPGIRKIFVIIVAFIICGLLFPINLAQAEASSSVNSPRIMDSVSRWDCIYFGRYPQSDASGATSDPIKWRVTKVNGNRIWMISDTKLDIQQFHTSNTVVSYANSYMKKWLNSTFLNKAFTAAEQGALIDAGNGKVQLISESEVSNSIFGFVSQASRCAKNTNYTIKKFQSLGVSSSSVNTGNGIYYGAYWLRESALPGQGGKIKTVRNVGNISEEFYVTNTKICIRPLICIDMNSTLWSHADKVMSNGATAPATPSNFNVVRSGDNTAKITWLSVSEADGYQIDSYKNGIYQGYHTAASQNYNTMNIKKLLTGTEYSYKMRAYWNVGDRKVYSGYTSLRTIQIPALSVPGNFKAKSDGFNKVTLTWERVGLADGYIIQKKVEGAKTWTACYTANSNDVVSWTDTGLRLNKTYKYKIQAFRMEDGKRKSSAFSQEVSVKAPKLSVPKGLKITKLGKNRIKVSWKKVKGATGYIVYSPNMKPNKKTTKNTYNNLKIMKNKTYTFKVKAYRNVKVRENGKTVTKQDCSSYTKGKKVKIKK